ncbi:MAG: hypothetical protein CMI29_04580 [Opitutae bacterium]|nr:hypothetical protein [Opitutae bacterium]|tara:strand:- start:2370 stop:2861 length:492 start_codon:yes stop_codon:yes gene_type:complete
MTKFDPLYFWTELPVEIMRKIIISAVSREKSTVAKIRSDHSDVARILLAHEIDLRTIGTLRATNKGQPFRPHLHDNRRYYYEATLEVWKLRELNSFRIKLGMQLQLSRYQVDHAYVSHWFVLHSHTKAIRDAGEGKPNALKRALCGLKEMSRIKAAQESAYQP